MNKPLLPLLIGVVTLTLAAHGETVTNTPGRSYTMRLYGIAGQFQWKEYFDGDQLLKESGPLFGLGGELALRLRGPFRAEGRGEYFTGDVDYNGVLMAQDGTLTPYQSTTEYTGIKGDADLACHMPLFAGLYLKPYAGMGARAWRRTLDTSWSDRHIGRYGYEEYWGTVYGILGVGTGLTFSRSGELSARLEARLPVDNTLRVDLSNQDGPDDLDLDPGKKVSYYADLSLRISHVTGSLFVETLEFSESPTVGGDLGFFQPRSKATYAGAKLGVAF